MTKTPTISIIIVTWNNENFIEQAVQSCFFLPDSAQKLSDTNSVPGAARPVPVRLRDVEIIVVHNASTDRTGALLQRMLSAHPGRFCVVENATNVGLGEARNIGVTHATGDHILFLDGDDYFDPSALAVLSHLLAKASPDVAVFNHARVYDSGVVRENGHTQKLTRRDASDVAARIELLQNFNVAWNKIYRTAFIRQHDLRFAVGLYEDVDWHFRALTLAQSVHALPDVLIYYRQRSGSILRSHSAAHRDIIDRYRSVMAFFAGHPQLASLYEQTAYKHGRSLMMNILIKEDRLPIDAKSQYLKDVTALLADWRAHLNINPRDRLLKYGAKLNPTLLGVAYGVYRGIKNSATYRYLHEKKKTPFKYARKSNDRLEYWSRIGMYNAFCLLPMKQNAVVIESFWGKKADCNPLAISDYLTAQGGYDITWSFHASVDTKGFPHKTATYGSIRYLRALACSKYLINNVNFPTEYKKRAGSVHVQTKHGTPLKSMGLDIRKRRPLEMDWDKFAERCRRWDYVISSNPYSSRVWRQGFPFNYKILETGYPRNDVLFSTTPDDVAAIRASLGVPKGKKVALYAPTFRSDDRENAVMFSDDLFNARLVAEALGDRYVLLVRSHYFTALKDTVPGAIDVSAYPHTNPLLAATDLLITDYSSIMFDFACLRRPIVIFAYDVDAYEKARGTYFSILDTNPGCIATTQGELLDCLAIKAFESAANVRKLNAFADEFCPWDDGRATARVVEAVFPPAKTA